MKRGRLRHIDIAKCIGIICIVYGHALTVGTPLRRWIFAFHVPFFFILSGFTFRPKPNRKFVIDEARKLLVPYFVASIISILIYTTAASHFITMEPEQRSILRNLFGMLIGNSKYGYMVWNRALWFVPCFFVATCIFNFITNAVNCKVSNVETKRSIILIVSIIGSAIGYVVSNILVFWLPFQMETALCMLCFLGLGYAVSPPFEKRWGGYCEEHIILSM